MVEWDYKHLNKGEITMSKPDNLTEEEFLAGYDMSKYSPIAGTVDIAIFTIRNNQLCVLLIERGGHPEKGKWALPGGFVEITEDIDESAARELKEETNITIEKGYLEQLKTYGNPHRDKRGYVISVAYVALAPNVEQPEAGDDAAKAHFFAVDEVLSGNFELAFDHEEIIREGLERVRSKIEYAPIAHHFLQGDLFTMSELRRVYEIVWGAEIVPSNFRRKIQSVSGIVEPVGGKRTSDFDGGRPSDLYRAGEATEIYPPFRQPKNEK